MWRPGAEAASKVPEQPIEQQVQSPAAAAPVDHAADETAGEAADDFRRHLDVRPTAEDALAKPPPRRRGLPSLSRGEAAGWAALVILVLAVAGVLVSGQRQLQGWWPATARLYEALGMASAPAGEGLAFRSVAPEWRLEQGEARLVVSGAIVNVSDQARRLPRVRVVLRDAEEREVLTETLSPGGTLAPGASAPFEVRLKPSRPVAALALLFTPAV